MNRGRPGDIPPHVIRKIRTMREKGMSYGAIAKKLDIPRSSVRYHASHDDVRRERNTHYRKSHPVIAVKKCTGCGEEGHFINNCKTTETKRVA